MIDPLLLEKIRANAEIVLAGARDRLDVEIDFDEGGVRWLDGYIERNREALDSTTIDSLVDIFGSFLGECIIRSYGGAWREVEERLGVYFNEKNAVYPFSKVAKQFKNGSEDSVLSLFTLIPDVFKLSGDSR